MIVRRSLARLLAALVLLAAVAVPRSHAQPHGDGPPRGGRHGAPVDTTRFLPGWMHPWIEFGGGWITRPKDMHPFYDSGQGFGAGLSAAPHRRVEIRAAIDYQMFQAHHDAAITVFDVTGTAVDTLRYAFDSNAWNGDLRAETGLEVLRGLWFTGGLGVGYMNGGFQDLSNIPGSGFTTAPPAAMLNGWGWAWTAAARYDVEFDPMVRLGLDVRSTSLKRGDDFVRWWSVRVCYRIPEKPPGPPAR